MTRFSIVSVCLLALTTALFADETPKTDPLANLSERFSVTEVDLDTAVNIGSFLINPRSLGQIATTRRVITSLLPNGELKVAWSDATGKIHITPLNADGTRKGADVVVSAGNMLDFVGHEDGAAIFGHWSSSANVVRLDADGKTKWTARTSGSTTTMHAGRMGHKPGQYAAYVGLHGGGHEGDTLAFLNEAGQRLSGGWGWGCSHSIDVRVHYAAEGFFPICISDAFPGTGIYYNHSVKRLAYEWGNAAGAVGATLGGWVEYLDSMVMAYTSSSAGSTQVYYVSMQKKSPHGGIAKTMLTSSRTTPANAKIGRYGESLLVSWYESAAKKQTFRLVDGSGKALSADQTLPAVFDPLDNFVRTPEGDLITTYAWGDMKKLKVMRLKAPAAKVEAP